MKARKNRRNGMTATQRRQPQTALGKKRVTSGSSSIQGKQRRRESATTLEDVLLVDGLQKEILKRVSRKRLISFTLVSKRWRTMIKDPYLSSCLKPRQNPAGIYIRRLTPQSQQTAFTLIPLDEVSGYERGGSKAIIPNVVFSQLVDTGVTINHSSNGLLICSSSPANYSARRFYLYNPTREQGNEIPRPFKDPVIAMNLAFEDPKFYRIFAVCQSKYGEYSLMEFAPSRSILLWRNIKVTFPNITTNDKVLYEYGVYVGGSLYWPHCLSTGLLYFNVHEEKLVWVQDIPQPHSNCLSTLAYFGECRGNLLMIRYRKTRGGMLDVLELRRDNPAMWYIKYQVDLKLDVPYVSNPVYVLAVVPGEEEEDSGSSYLIIHILGKVLSYNFKHRSMNKLYDLDLPAFQMKVMRSQPWKYVHSYRETVIEPRLLSLGTEYDDSDEDDGKDGKDERVSS